MKAEQESPREEGRPGWIGYPGLCRELDISRPTAERLVAQGMPHIKVGKLVRFSMPRVIAWLEQKSARR